MHCELIRIIQRQEKQTNDKSGEDYGRIFHLLDNVTKE
jgi:hypothetical protein